MEDYTGNREQLFPDSNIKYTSVMSVYRPNMVLYAWVWK